MDTLLNYDDLAYRTDAALYELHDAVFFHLVHSAPGSVARSTAIANLDLIKGVLFQGRSRRLHRLRAAWAQASQNGAR